ncbi:MAG: glutamine-hydrolyzing GMP synthase [Candidatus Latescibacteria bacterium]|nr:glutamine-hydrolyzing GMP synthase [Candidatus Latescibacterota bacterium]
MQSGIAVLDFGGQYSHLIANRIRRLNVYSQIFAPDADLAQLEGACGVIFSGGPASVYDPNQPAFNPELIASGLPTLGLCYGHQLICKHLGGEVVAGDVREFGSATLEIVPNTELFAGLGTQEEVWMSHGDVVAQLPDGFRSLGETHDCPTAAVGDDKRRIYGVQFHPEVAHTPNGMAMLDNFLNICEAPRTWTMANYAEVAMEAIREQVGERNVFLLVSGGVDSSVAFVLFNQALGADRVLGLHIDNGFMRKAETATVEAFLNREGFHNLKVEDASEDFLLSVEGMVEPEMKREAIGKTFLDVKDKVLARLNLDPDHWLLGQGTLYPDTIESGGTEHAALIKTHHNRIDLIEELIEQGKVIEPLAQLYKDEVRDLGTELGLPDDLVWRHPFPGPGLAVRCLCSDGVVLGEDLTDAEDRAAKIASEFGLQLRILPVKSVGVQGDYRTYAHPAVVWGNADWSVLEEVSTRITNSIRDINRVLYLITPDVLPDLKLKRSFLVRSRLDLLREADAIAMKALLDAQFMEEVSQMPTVFLPLTTDGQTESVVLRPITTPDFMTARFSELPIELVSQMGRDILALEGVNAVFYDVTHKPPGTVEWE